MQNPRGTKLSSFLKEKRLNAGLSQLEVATHLGYTSAQFISNWERGLAAPPVHTIKKLSTLYKVKVEDIFEIHLEDTLMLVKQELQKRFFGKVRKNA